MEVLYCVRMHIRVYSCACMCTDIKHANNVCVYSHTYTYIKQSILVNGYQTLRIPANRPNHVTLILRNTSPKFGLPPFDQLFVLFFDQQATLTTVTPLGSDLRVTFMAPPFSSTSVPVKFSFRMQETEASFLSLTGDGKTPFTLQAVDLLRPSVVGVAPSSGPALGGYFLVIGVFGEFLCSFLYQNNVMLAFM
jgi:hypothetical protein